MMRFGARSLDLNLLSVFVTLWDTRSVSRASEILSVTQPAVSHALRRLRDALGDELFVSGRSGLVPTARAIELINPVRGALGSIHRAVDHQPTFQPATAQQEFRIASLDFIEFWLLPELLEQLRQVAPGITIRSIPIPEAASARALLEAGDINIIIDSQPISGAGVHCQSLTEIPLVTLIRKQEKLRSRRFPLDLFLSRPHVVSLQRTRTGDIIEKALHARGVKREIAAIATNNLTMAAVAEATGYVCTIPAQIADHVAKVFNLSVHQPPIPFRPFSLFHAWHSRFESDPAHLWLLERIREVVTLVRARADAKFERRTKPR